MTPHVERPELHPPASSSSSSAAAAGGGCLHHHMIPRVTVTLHQAPIHHRAVRWQHSYTVPRLTAASQQLRWRDVLRRASQQCVGGDALELAFARTHLFFYLHVVHFDGDGFAGWLHLPQVEAPVRDKTVTLTRSSCVPSARSHVRVAAGHGLPAASLRRST